MAFRLYVTWKRCISIGSEDKLESKKPQRRHTLDNTCKLMILVKVQKLLAIIQMRRSMGGIALPTERNVRQI
jgi:hypothetical protein